MLFDIITVRRPGSERVRWSGASRLGGHVDARSEPASSRRRSRCARRIGRLSQSRGLIARTESWSTRGVSFFFGRGRESFLVLSKFSSITRVRKRPACNRYRVVVSAACRKNAAVLCARWCVVGGAGVECVALAGRVSLGRRRRSGVSGGAARSVGVWGGAVTTTRAHAHTHTRGLAARRGAPRRHPSRYIASPASPAGLVSSARVASRRLSS